jgi:hypothetical protein
MRHRYTHIRAITGDENHVRLAQVRRISLQV